MAIFSLHFCTLLLKKQYGLAGNNLPFLKMSVNGGTGDQTEKITVLWMNDSSAKVAPEINFTASFILNSFYFKIHVPADNVIQTMNTFVLFKGRSST